MIVRTLLLALLLIGVVLHSEELEVGKVYTGPVKLSAPNFGASLMLPDGWDAQLVKQRGPLVLQSRSDSSRILMEANLSVTGSALALLGEKIEYYGLELFSPAQIKHMRPSQYYRLYQVEGSDTFSQALVYLVLGTQGRAVLLYGFFTPGGYEAMRQTMMTLSDTMGFTAIRALPTQLTSLYMQIQGGHFVFYERRSSFSEKRELWLCLSGETLLKSTQASANKTTRVKIGRRGKWRLEGNRLILEFVDGTEERYRVTQEQNTLYFDGAQTFRLPNYACQ